MQTSLSWIEWLDRLDRVLKGAREDVRALAGFESPRSVAAVELCTRQLAALNSELKLLDRNVLSAKNGATIITKPIPPLKTRSISASATLPSRCSQGKTGGKSQLPRFTNTRRLAGNMRGTLSTMPPPVMCARPRTTFFFTG